MQCSVRVGHSETKKVEQSWQTATHARQDSIVTKRVLKNQVVKIVVVFSLWDIYGKVTVQQ